MADKRKGVGGGPLTHTLQFWPVEEVIAQSAYWPAWWYRAYERAARQLADGVACCILGGLPDCPEPIRMELQPSGSLTFSVHLRGTTIEVFIWHFEGPDDPEPDAPGPNGGVRQRTADGLVLGLRGTGKDFSVARFYDGLVPPVPVGRGGRLWPSTARVTTAASWAAAMPRMAPATATEHHVTTACVRSTTGVGGVCCAIPSARERPAITSRPEIKIEMRRSYRMNTTPKESLRTLSPFTCIEPELFNSERPSAFSDPIYGSTICDLYIGRETSPSTGAASLRLN